MITEEILKELIAITNARRENDTEQYVVGVLHPKEDELEKKTPGFYVLWSVDYRMYGLFPVDC